MKHTSNLTKRLVVKVGTTSLVDKAGALNAIKIENLVRQLAMLRDRDNDVLLVTSGAIRAGMERLGLTTRPRSIPMQQAAAAVGQLRLMQSYGEAFSTYGIPVAQVLLTRDDFRSRTRYLNGRNTILSLLSLGCVPIVNENDTVAVEEIKFGENDTLAALVAVCVDADVLINLSDVDGLYNGDPRENDGCQLISDVPEITQEIEDLAGSPGVCGSGGMRSKIESAKIAVKSGVRMVIANANRPNVILEVADGEKVGTTFISSTSELTHRQRWIAFGDRVRGSVMVNAGARKMLVERGKSLLPAGIMSCEGNFRHGDLIAIVSEDQEQLARGLTNYDSTEIDMIKGKQSSNIEYILGHTEGDEVIHRDNMVMGV